MMLPIAEGATVKFALQVAFLAALACLTSTTADAQHRADPFRWTGFYAGVNAGVALDQARFDHRATGDFLPFPPASANLAALGSGEFDPEGGIAGGQIGYNWQRGHWVAGVEADIQWRGGSYSESSSTSPAVYFPGLTASFQTSMSSNVLSTLRLRTGITVHDMLFYVTGGLAISQFEFSQTVNFGPFPEAATGSVKDTKFGWTIGAGGEFALTRNWALKAEYLFVQFDNLNVELFNPTSPTFTHEVRVDDLQTHVLRLGLNYTF
ncbi:MAG: porin family protein [Rhodospirillales bacterium]|nr:porin family protein [Rhodospirillales bacterium]